MSQFNLSIFLQAYSDANSSNSPSLTSFKWNRNAKSLQVTNPSESIIQLAPGEQRSLFDHSRDLSQDDTTEYSLSLVEGTANTYDLNWSGGTAPNFRTPRVTGADATTQVVVATNGPVLTFSTPLAGVAASFVGQVAGMTTDVTITSDNLGTSGNSVVLVGDGASNLNLLISNWNAANPSNEITLTSGNGSQIPALVYASFIGTVPGLSTSVTITANQAGSIGNSVVLTGDSTSSINTLISAWNTANPSNEVSLTSGDGTQIPYGDTQASFSGVIPGTSTSVTLTANNFGPSGNSIVLLGDGSSTINELITDWNASNPTDLVNLTSGNGLQIPVSLSSTDLSGGVNASVIDLSGGESISLSGGASYSQFSLSSGGVQVGDVVFIGDLFNTINQGFFQIIAFTNTSFSVANLSGVNEGPITLGSDYASQIQIFSALGIQINDKLVISGGFSEFSWGTYVITQVLANSLQFYSTSILPQEGPITTEDIAIYFAAKQFVYIEADQSCSVLINGEVTEAIEPFVNTGVPCPGLFMRTSTIYSMSVTNNSETIPANVVLLSVE